MCSLSPPSAHARFICTVQYGLDSSPQVQSIALDEIHDWLESHPLPAGSRRWYDIRGFDFQVVFLCGGAK